MSPGNGNYFQAINVNNAFQFIFPDICLELCLKWQKDE